MTRTQIRAMADPLLIETLLVTLILDGERGRDREGDRVRDLLAAEITRRGLTSRAEARAREWVQAERKRLG